MAAWLTLAMPARNLTLPIPSEVTGDTNPDVPSCQDYRTCINRGHQDWLELVSRATEAHPVDVPSTQKTFDESYGCVFISSDDDPIWNVREDLERHGFDYRWIKAFGVFSKNPATGEETEKTAYLNMFDTQKGLIVADENFRQYDEQKKLHWSELMYHAWKTAREDADESHRANIPPGAPPGGPISTLQTVVRHQAMNDVAVIVIQEIRRRMPDWTIEDGDWHKFSVAEDTREWFYALLGVVNVQGVIWLLKDHAAEIGQKVVTEIYVKWSRAWPDIWINIGPLNNNNIQTA